MKRYAFIDVHNTKGTATILDFTIDPAKLFDYLKYQKWSCSEVFWYSGRIKNEKHEKERAKIERVGFKIRDKPTRFYEQRVRICEIVCPNCKHQHELIVKRKGLPKANCDVELTVDCVELASPETEFLIFTGDGDFKYLVEKLVEKKSKVYIFSTKKKDSYGDYRFSTRYNDLLKTGAITFVEMSNLKFRIGKESSNRRSNNEETAAKRDGPER